MIKTLFIAPQVPWPLDVGSKIRVHNLLRSYAEMGAVTLVCFAQSEAEAQNVTEIEQHVHRVFCFPLAAAGSGVASRAGKLAVLREAIHPTPRALRDFRSEALAIRVESLLAGEPFDILHVEQLYMVENVRRALRRRLGGPGLFRVLDVMDVESRRMKRMAAVEPWSSPLRYVRGLESLKLYASEQRVLPHFDCALVCSENDRGVLQTRRRPPRVEVFANGADLDARGVPAGEGDDGRTLVFLGAMNYRPNEDAVLFFVRSVLPLLRQRVPDLRFVVAGKSPSASVRVLHNGADVLVTGYVQDKADLFRSCTVFIVPIRIGGGTRIKILEAMAAGAPVVSTSVGCEGIDATPDEDILVADTPRDFAAACATLLLDPVRRQDLARAGRLFVERGYRWEDIRKRYIKTLEKTLAPSLSAVGTRRAQR